MNEKIKELWNSKKRIPIIVGCIAVFLVLVTGGVCIANGLASAENNSSDTSTPEGNEQKEVSMVVSIPADGWDAKQSTKFGVVLTNLVTNEKLRFEIEPNKDQTITAPEGEYEIEYVSGVNADGSMWKVPEKATITLNQEYVANHPVTTIPVEKIEADKVTEQDKTNANISGNLDDTPAASGSVDGNVSGGGSTTTSSAPSGNAGNNGSTASQAPSGNNNNSGGNSNNPSPTPAHTHTWVEQTSSVWIPNVVEVVDSEAYDEVTGQTPIYGPVEHRICNEPSCAADLSNLSTSQIRDHIKAHALAGQYSGYHGVPSYEIIGYEDEVTHHPAQSHQEDRGSWQTSVTGYKCSGCGATKGA